MKRKILTALFAAVAAIFLIIGFSGCEYGYDPRSYQKESGGVHYSYGTVQYCCDDDAAEIVIQNSITYYNIIGGETEDKTYKVTEIKANAFRGHKNLERVVIPETVTKIAPTAFAGCEKLKSIEIAKGNTVYHSAGNSIIETESKTLVAGCPSSVIPEDGSVTKIGENAFCELVAETITIPESITEICERAFYNSRLQSVTLPASAVIIYENAFENCDDLESITVNQNNPAFSSYNGVMYNKAQTEFFIVPKNLTGEVEIAANLTDLSDFAFKDCKKITSVVIHDKVKRIGEGAFEGCTGITALTIPDTVEFITEGALSKCAGLESLTFPFKIKDKNFDFYGALFGYLFSEEEFDGSLKVTANYRTFYIPEKLTSVTVTDGEVGNSAFQNCTNLKSVVLEEKIKTISQKAFYNCTSLESIVLKSVETIDHFAFNGCSNLKSITIPNTFKEGKSSSFFGCGELNDITMPATAIDLIKPLSTKKLTITGEIIPFYSFRDMNSLEEVVIGDNVSVIENGVFSGCKNLKKVDLGNGVKEIGSFAFPAPEKYSLEYTIFDNAYYLGNSQNPYYFLAERKDKNIESCDIHPETRIIGSSAFNNCEKLKDVTIPKKVITIEYRAFYGCTSIEKLILPQSLKILGEGSLCSCRGLKYLYIPSGVERIDDYATQSLNMVSQVYYEGTEEKLNEICVGDKNFKSNYGAHFLKLYYYSETQPTQEGYYWHYGENKEITIWNNQE
ncbi:MAG: leucine-rich repeat domain-containing protein [Clostridia bacterium]|nr:leucine-rich repeat domain-containing protein [Clostridia bacterium]